jgi:DNA-binding response OmpR family regulator
MRILLIEDDASLAELIRVGLQAHGFTVDHVDGGEDGLAAAETIDYDALILDLSLPDMDGIEVLKSLRKRPVRAPVLILSARGALGSRIDGLNAGADDFLPKPFDLGELTARLRALMRRPKEMLNSDLACGNLRLSPHRREVLVDGKPISLPRRELSVLEHLMRSPGMPVSKARLEEGLYGFDEEVASNSVEVHIHHVRKRLKEAGATVRIETRRGLGYVLIPGA